MPLSLERIDNKTRAQEVWEDFMFDSLDEEIKRDDEAVSTPRERWLRYGVVLLVSTAMFAGLYAGIKFLE
jgi:hypothetical protein